MTSQAWAISCDATALPSSGRIGLGALLQAPDGTRHFLSQEASARGCNNEAEARALIVALEAALSMGAREVMVQCDSDVVVRQVVGAARTKIQRLASLFQRARELLECFERAELRLVPRARNVDADALARAAVGLAPKQARSLRRRCARGQRVYSSPSASMPSSS